MLGKPTTTRPCLYCGALFHPHPSAIRAGGGKYCRRACYDGAHPPLPATERFWRHVARTDRVPAHDPELGPCWLWTGSTFPAGYGNFDASEGGPVRRPMHASRFAWKLAAGMFPQPHLVILHACDNPRCVRNDPAGTYEIGSVLLPRWGHLVLGSQADNLRDMVNKGHSAHGERHYLHLDPSLRHGTKNPAAKLTDAEIVAIRERYATGTETQRTIATAFGVTQTLVSQIVRRLIWGHVP